MKLPFTVDEFLKVFKEYNLTVWPIQLILAALAIGSIFLGIQKKQFSGKTISIILALLWFWMGVVYHLFFFTTINKAAYFFGIIFIIQGILFLYAGILKKQLFFQVKKNIHGIIGSFFIVFALIIYPLIGYYLGHVYPSTPTFGLPCPTTIFTFGILLWTDKKFPIYILIIPFLWAIIGFSASFSLGIKEDIALIVTGTISVILLVIKRRKFVP